MKKELNFEFKINNSEISRISVGEFQSVGARPYQEDSYDYCSFKTAKGEQGFCAVLSDGMGGLSNGDKVSGDTVSGYIKRLTRLSKDSDIHKSFISITNDINAQVVSGKYGGGATAVAVYCCPEGIFFCSTGDSRLYLFRNNAITQLTEDFDVINRELGKVIDGQLTYAEADANPERNNLVEFIGANKELSPDVNIKPLIPQKGDKLLICSDGVYNALSDREFIYCLNADAISAADTMKSGIADKAVPTQDNATAIILEFM